MNTWSDALKAAGMLGTNARVYRAEPHERTRWAVIATQRITLMLGKKPFSYYATVVERAQR